jgi:hypothetical protein
MFDQLSAIERRFRGRAVPVARSVASPPAGFGVLWIDQVTGRLTLRRADGTSTSYAASAGTVSVSSRYVVADPRPTLATGIERYRGLLRLAEQPTFLGSSVNDLTSTSPGWTYANSGKLTTATRNAGTLAWAHAASASASSSNTAPHRYRLYRPMQAIQRWITRVRHDCNANYEFAGIRICPDSAPTTVVNIATGYAGGVFVVGGSSAGDVGLGSTAVVTNGVWLMADIVGGTVRLYYSTSTSSTPPTASTDWVLFSSTSSIAAGTLLRVGMYADNGGLGGANTIDWYYWTDSYAMGEGGPVIPPGGGGSGYDTTGAVQVIVSSIDLGSDSATVTDANVRLALVQAENTIVGDSATITWSVTRSTSASPAAATTYQSSSTVNVKTGGTDTTTSTGRYLAVRCKITSDGTQRGSVSLVDLRIPFTA